ncbi:DUF3854 domain-containing protein [Gemmata sp. G18]|uniref:DUF3854 domain-containing protein n=1 Tax=Gemmata palustris TaxID=2822762 RepID=A0ABS5BRU6_9BACT|nr:phage/plasmid primase, P4 family [Gemmata palustris]MBP3956454.1 DUF3854 domain-containing protein [Gemmata palustris]
MFPTTFPQLREGSSCPPPPHPQVSHHMSAVPSSADAQSPLSARHLADLRASGLRDETIVAAAIHTESDPVAVARLINWRRADRLGPCLVFPHVGIDGQPRDYATLKPDAPLVNAKGKARKYECPKGRPCGAYFPPRTIAAIADPLAPLVITEGIKKCLAADQDGIATIGLSGVYSFQKARPKVGGKPTGPRVLIDELAAISWQSRPVTIIYDSDAATNPNVRLAEWHLAVTLHQAGATIRVARLPCAADGSKLGLDDFLVTHGVDALRTLIDGASRPARPPRILPTPPPDAPPRFPCPNPGEAWNDPHRLARLLVDETRTLEGHSTFLQWRDDYHRWQTAWRPVPDSDLDAHVARHARHVFEIDFPVRLAVHAQAVALEDKKGKPPTLFPVTTKTKSDVKVNLSGMVNQPDTGADAPFWLWGNVTHDPAHVIAAPNGLFTLADIATGRPPFEPPTPRLFSFNALPFEVPVGEPELPTVWLGALEQWFNGDSRSILGLQEWLGYMLSASTAANKILMLIGPPRSGKGTVLRLMAQLIGEANIASTTFSRLGESFGLAPLLGKRIATIPDARLAGRADLPAVVERLLSISGNDQQSVNRKGRPCISTFLKVRFVIATNEVPQLPDASGALASRFHILSFPNSFLGREDPDLDQKLTRELPAILAWAARGFVRLCTNRMAFTQNEAATRFHREVEDLSSPVKAFVRERCSIGPQYDVAIHQLCHEWQDWNESCNKKCSDDNVFGRDLRAAFPHITTSQPRVSGKRVRFYNGIGIRARADWGDAEEPVERAGTCTTPAQSSIEKDLLSDVLEH